MIGELLSQPTSFIITMEHNKKQCTNASNLIDNGIITNTDELYRYKDLEIEIEKFRRSFDFHNEESELYDPKIYSYRQIFGSRDINTLSLKELFIIGFNPNCTLEEINTNNHDKKIKNIHKSLQ